MKEALKTFAFLAVLGAGFWLWTRSGAADYASGGSARARLQDAVALARRDQRRVLLEIGSSDCVWCSRLNRLLEADPDIRSAARKDFVMVRLDYRGNEDLLRGYPPIDGTPFFYVLDQDGALLSPQDTDAFESGEDYDRGKLLAFFEKWGPPPEKRGG